MKHCSENGPSSLRSLAFTVGVLPPTLSLTSFGFQPIFTASMPADVSKKPRASSAPPRKINVQKFAEARAAELEALHSIVENRLSNDLRSRRNKRRRTTAYDSQIAKRRCRKRRKLETVANKSNDNASASEKDQKKLPRRVRRAMELKKNCVSGFSTSGDGTKRLRTHVWHAKRFTMTKLWGFHIPLGLQGR